MYKLELQTQFSSAHQLTNAYDEKCNDSIHGHNWKVIITIQVIELNAGKGNMVIDFTQLKDIIKELDHKNLNKILFFEPTAENIARWIYNEIHCILTKLYNNTNNYSLEIKLFEADNASITYTVLQYETL